MFTGIITDIGNVSQVEMRGDMRARIACHYDMAGVDLGASIACDGVCLTVVERARTGSRSTSRPRPCPKPTSARTAGRPASG